MEKITLKNPMLIGAGGNADSHEMEYQVNSLADVSDGYHTIEELYEHRHTLFIALSRSLSEFSGTYDDKNVWRSKVHSDGKLVYEGWFIMGIRKEPGDQISYHLPISYWEETDFAETLGRAPEFDGHTSKDVLERLKGV